MTHLNCLSLSNDLLSVSVWSHYIFLTLLIFQKALSSYATVYQIIQVSGIPSANLEIHPPPPHEIRKCVLFAVFSASEQVDPVTKLWLMLVVLVRKGLIVPTSEGSVQNGLTMSSVTRS